MIKNRKESVGTTQHLLDTHGGPVDGAHPTTISTLQSRSPHETDRRLLWVGRATEFAEQQEYWERVLEKEGLAPEAEPLFLGTESVELIEALRTLKIADSIVDEEAAGLGVKGDDVMIHRALAKLNDREKEVLTLRFGFDGHGEKTLEEVGKGFGVSRERIRQIETKALAKLRRLSSRLGGVIRDDDEPTADEVRAYHEFVQGRLKLPADLGQNPTAKQIASFYAVQQARELWREGDAYGDLICKIFFNDPRSENRSSAYNIMDVLSKMLGNSDWNDFNGRSKIALKLSEQIPQEDLARASNLLKVTNVPTIDYWRLRPEEQQELAFKRRAELNEQLDKILGLLI